MNSHRKPSAVNKRKKSENEPHPQSKTLITIVGTRDPYVDSLVEDMERTGPILGLLSHDKSFQRVVLLAQPVTKERTQRTREAIMKLFPHIRVMTMDLNILDPISYSDILREMRKVIPLILEDASDQQLFINVSSGTPQMHSCWILLAASGEIPARIINIRESKFVTKERGYFTQLDFTSPDFPIVRTAPRYLNEGTGNETDLGSALQQMGFVADHPAMRKVIEMIAILAPIERSILILGDTGTGKEITAKLLHRYSKRAAQPFVAINCGAIPKDLAESILFGHRKGSFTGAVSDHPGKFREAHKGTLFLDELGELPEATQVKLLRVLQTGEIEPVGESKTVKVDVRVIAATNADMIKSIGSGKFREDLYHRVAKSVIRLPSLAERKTDIPKIALLVLDRINGQLKKSKRISPGALMKLQMHSWPGNIRELENVVENAVILSRQDVITEDDIELSSLQNNENRPQLPVPEPGFSIEKYLSNIRQQLIVKALEITGGKQSEASRLLGISPQAVNNYLKKSEGLLNAEKGTD